MKGPDDSDEQAARLYAQGLQIIKEGDRKLADAFSAQQRDGETLELLLLQREAIAMQREGLALIDAATELRCEALKNRQQSRFASNSTGGH